MKGFTLIELMILVTIVLIIAAIIAPMIVKKPLAQAPYVEGYAAGSCVCN